LAFDCFLFLAACSNSNNFVAQIQDWQFVEIDNQCEIQSTNIQNPIIIWQSDNDKLYSKTGMNLLIKLNPLLEISDDEIVIIYLDQIKFEIPAITTSVTKQIFLNYQALGSIAPFFLSAVARSNVMTLEIKQMKYTYNNRGFGILADLWTECYIFHSR
jgi:hypothetical protein